MSDESPVNKNKELTKVQVEDVSEDNLYSIDDLENLIKESDPDFLGQLDSIGKNEEWDGVDLARFNLDAPDPKTIKERLIYLKEWIKNKFYYSMILTEQWVYYFIVKFLPTIAIKFKNLIVQIFQFISLKIKNFLALPLKVKVSYLFIVLSIGVLSYYIYFSLTTDILTREKKIFITSMEDWSQVSKTYDKNRVEPFYSSTRTMQNIMSLRRIVANLSRSAKSGPRPMVALELYFEGTTPEGVVEIKDRDYEIKDRISRILEETTFDQLDTIEGKQVFLEKVKRDINQILTKGKIRRTLYKTIILKP